jgi:hypothetical protein
MEANGSATRPDADTPPHRERTALDESTPAALKGAAEDAMSSVEQLYRVGDAFLERQAHERPHLLLGAAAGIGFVLGGGLAWRMTGALVNLVGRMAVTHAVDGWATSTIARASKQ